MEFIWLCGGLLVVAVAGELLLGVACDVWRCLFRRRL